MASFTGPLTTSVAYAGLERIFEFVNGDGRLTKWNCGQAAATTLLTHFDKLRLGDDATELMRRIELHFPPDILGGWFGSSRRRVMRICKEHDLPLKEVRGEADLRRELTVGNPAVVMLGVEAGRFWRWDLPGGHWMVAYGFDDDAIHLTNWGEPMPWPEFRRRWQAWAPRLIQMSGRALAARVGVPAFAGKT